MSYYATLWDVFEGKASVEVFLTEYQGAPVSAQLTIGFGDSVFTKNSGWSGKHSTLGPNHVLEWTTIQWAKASGFRVYDLEGIDPRAAQMILNGQRLPPEMTRQPFFWKLGFGGEVVMFPGPYVYIPNAALRKVYSKAYPLAARSPAATRIVNRIRTG